MSHSADEGELTGQDKQEVFQDLLSGSEYVLLAPFRSVCFAEQWQGWPIATLSGEIKMDLPIDTPIFGPHPCFLCRSSQGRTGESG